LKALFITFNKLELEIESICVLKKGYELYKYQI